MKKNLIYKKVLINSFDFYILNLQWNVNYENRANNIQFILFIIQELLLDFKFEFSNFRTSKPSTNAMNIKTIFFILMA